MTSFNFTTGNPNNLVGGSNASMADIQGSLTDVRTFVNGGNLDETNVPNLAAAFTTYKQLFSFRAQLTSAGAAGRYAMFTSAPSNTNVLYNSASAPIYSTLVYLDPTDFNANSRVTKLNLQLIVVPNSVAPGITYTASLYNVTVLGGTGPATPFVTTANLVAGSTAQVAGPAALAMSTSSSGDFTCPAAGFYVVNVSTTGTPPTNNVSDILVQLRMRQV